MDEPQELMPISVALMANYDYQISSTPPTAGQAHQPANNKTIVINNTDHDGHDNTTILNKTSVGSTVTINGVTFNIIGVNSGSTITTLTITPIGSAPPFGVTGFQFSAIVPGTGAVFPFFQPIVPPPVIGQGGGPPPAFPPPTPPPIGAIPPGVLVGPAIAAAGVPPSNAGYVQPRFGTGSANLPSAASWFPEFTTAPYTGFPNQPPTGVPIVFSNIYTGGATQTTPPHTNTTAVLPLGTNWGPPIGPALPHIASEMFAEAEKFEGTTYEQQARQFEREGYADHERRQPEMHPPEEPDEPDEPEPTKPRRTTTRRHHR